jgi:hypothetical protein
MSCFNAAEEDRNTKAIESETTIERVPSSNLGACLEGIGELQRNNPKDWIVLSHMLITRCNGDNPGAPVSHESFSTCVKDGLAAGHHG